MVKQGYEKRSDSINWNPKVTVEKWTAEQVADAERRGVPLSEVKPAEVVTDEGNLLTTAGQARLISLLAGAGGQAADATHTLLGVGTSTTAAAEGDTALNGTAYYMTPDATYPNVSGDTLTLKATYSGSVANHTWQEWGIFITNGAASAGTSPGAGILLNHKVFDLGTKASGAVWSLTVTVNV